MDVESLISATSRAQQASEAGIGNCAQRLHLGFFFDGVHRNLEQDASEQRLSNIARLFRAYPGPEDSTEHEMYNAFYISGLGTPFHENVVAKLNAMMDGAHSTVLDDINGQPGNVAEEVGLELLKGSNWYEVLKSQAKKLINPTEWKKLVVDTGKNVVKKVSIEAVPFLRDNETISDMFVTGADTRISSAKVTFEEAFKESQKKSEVPIKLISISLFGFDLGATLARKFIDLLLEDLCQKDGDKHTYQGIPLDIMFAGLFDCSRHTPASNNNGVDWFVATAGGPVSGISILLGDMSIDQDTALNPAVKKALHLVAAHETRPWRSLYRLGGDAAVFQEELLPGCAEDVGGGLKPNEQKPSAELSRVALQRMYRAATMAGVPFLDFQTLNVNNPVVAAYFIMQDNVENKSVAQWTQIYQRALPYKMITVGGQNAHLTSYIDWLGRQYYHYRKECLHYERQRENTLSCAEASAGLLGITPQARTAASGIQNELVILKKNWGWLEDVHDAALKMKNSMETNPADKRLSLQPDIYRPALRRAKLFLNYAHAAWQDLPQPFHEDTAPSEMYAWFIHDLQTVEKGARISEDFLVIRSMEIPES